MAMTIVISEEATAYLSEENFTLGNHLSLRKESFYFSRYSGLHSSSLSLVQAEC